MTFGSRRQFSWSIHLDVELLSYKIYVCSTLLGYFQVVFKVLSQSALQQQMIVPAALHTCHNLVL